MRLNRFYLIVGDTALLARLLPLGVRLVQLRAKGLTPAELHRQIAQSRDLCAAHGAQLVVNDHWQAALDLGCDAVHLGQEDMDSADFASIQRAGLHLGLSTHNHAEAQRAMAMRPSYIALGPIFPTTTKVMPFEPQGLERLREWMQCYGKHTAICAIGGINASNFSALAQTDVPAIAMVNGLRPEQPNWDESWLLYQTWQNTPS